MTVIIKSHKSNEYYITLSIEARTYGNIYIVEAVPRINDDLYGFPESQMIYSDDERKKADATFRRYCKKYS